MTQWAATGGAYQLQLYVNGNGKGSSSSSLIAYNATQDDVLTALDNMAS